MSDESNEFEDVTYEVVLSVEDVDRAPQSRDIARVLYRGLDGIATPDAIFVTTADDDRKTPGTVYERRGPENDPEGRLADFARFALDELNEILGLLGGLGFDPASRLSRHVTIMGSSAREIVEALLGYTTAADGEETKPRPKARLEELRAVLRSESMSYGELVELQGLAAFIAEGDVELLEAAGVPEFPDAPDAEANGIGGSPDFSSEAAKVRAALQDDPTVSNADYGRLVEEAADADERRSWNAEKGDA